MFKKISFMMALAAVIFTTQLPSASADTIVEIAQSDPATFSALVDAVVAQDLVDTLSSDGPFTVFAPTNNAFGALPFYITDILEKKPELLSDILLYHVVPGEFFATDVLATNRLSTALGEKVRVNTTSEGAFINSSELIATDVDADNGVVHVVDRVLIPNKVYRAVIDDYRDRIRELLRERQEVGRDRISERFAH